ncbi:MAG: hypothetical protein CMJ65_15505 [Planctomycetaceae bacterium]|jgi:hypothetical protein|nr:hypothetical protein [Planctomycetaceae bacterium]
MLKKDLQTPPRPGTRRARFCDGIDRRDALTLGGTGLLGGLSLPGLLRLEAEAAAPKPATATSCIMLFLEGGPSTIDMWDLKPKAPKEIRGPYRQISTKVPGTFFGEHQPLCARVADKFTLLRSHSHADNGHSTGYHYVLTGRKAGFPDGNLRVPTNDLYPSLGSIVARETDRQGTVPPYVNLPNPMGAGGPGFYGAEFAPFVIESDPVQPDFQVKDLRVATGPPATRLARRRSLLDRFEKLHGKTSLPGRAGVMSTYYQKAYDLITSPAAREAFDVHRESDTMRARYGHTSLGQCALLARRLVEAGCRFVGVDHGSWDTHFDCFPSQEKDLFPHADRAFSSLVTDLEDRGLLDSTLVVMMGEMGRTPKINGRAGRDHWSQAQSVLLAGGGIRPGRLVGATDKHAATPLSDPVGVDDLLRTILTMMGINADRTYYTPLGRPVPLVKDGRFLGELL